MEITNRKLLLFGAFATVLFNVVVLSGFNILFIGSAYSFLYLSIVPGFFIQRLLKIQGITFFESITYIVGFSISYLYLVGICTNLLGLIPNISHPLNMENSLIIFNIYTTLLLFSLMGRNNASIYLTLPKVTFIQFFFYIVPFFFPIMSILGADTLNHNGTDTLTMILLISIAFYVLITTILIKKLEQIHFEIPIYLIAVSLLFMFSLRSSYVIGWDIYQEYKVFLLTQSHQLWSMSNFEDPYNACLSITILPTLLHYFTKIDDPYVFKILFQLMFALVPITVYSLTKRFSNNLIAFISAFFFMSTLDFFLEMPALDRQEIAFVFFGLLLLMLFTNQLAPLQKKILFVLFSFSIVLSHYSTTYILIVIFAFACIVLTLYRRIIYKKFHVISRNYTLEPMPVILFMIFSFLWLGVITNTSNNFVSTIRSTVNNVTNYDMQTLNTSIVAQFLHTDTTNNNDLLNQNIDITQNEYQNYHFTFYPKLTYKDYHPTIITSTDLPLHVPKIMSNIVYGVSNSITKILKFLLIIGFIFTIILSWKKVFPTEYAILSAGFAITLIIFTSVPSISSFYPIGRLDQQTLFLIALPCTLSLFLLLRFIPFKIRGLLIALFFITNFLNTTTFTSQLVGGQNPQIFLNNSGIYYNETYLHPSEIASIHWLYLNKDKQSPVFADTGSEEKMGPYSGQKYLTTYSEVFPSLIDKNSYVYSNYANTLYNIGIDNPKDTRVEYNFPSKFLNDNMNLIYSNYETKIYK